jgi:FHA domain
MVVTCPTCGVSNPSGSTICAGCGASLTAPSGARPRVLLRVVRADGGAETVLPMRGEVMTVGTAGDLTLPDDPFVAPVQVRFFFSGGRLAVEDAGGGNGVFARLRAERELPVGGELRLGRQRLLLELVPLPVAGADGALSWGSPDPGYRLRIVQLLDGGIRGAAFPLREGDNLLGRETGDIAFPTDGFVSGRHAVLKARGERLVVRDVGSSNGTFLRLTNAVFVDSGDQFLIGRELVRVELQPA